MLEKVLVFIGIPVDNNTEKEWDAMLEASGYQAFFTANEWQDVDLNGCVSRAKAVRHYLKRYFSTSEAIYVDQPQRLIAIKETMANDNEEMPFLPMPNSPIELLDQLDAIFAIA